MQDNKLPNWFIVEYYNGQPTKIFNVNEFNLSPQENWSWSYFRKRHNIVNKDYLKKDTKWYNDKSLLDWNMTLNHMYNSDWDFMKQEYTRLSSLEIINCKNLWEFYEKIGYDRKNKKFYSISQSFKSE